MSALSLNNNGILEIKIVDDNNYVVFTVIEIVDYEDNGVLVVANIMKVAYKGNEIGSSIFVKPWLIRYNSNVELTLQ